MAGDFKNDSLLRTVLVLFIGVLAFGLFFNLFTGGGTMGGGDHMGNMGSMGTMGSMGAMGTMGSMGYSFGNLIGGLLILLVKLLLIVLVITIVIGILGWIKKNFFQNTNSQFIQSIKQDPILRTISVVTLVIIGIVFLLALLGSFNQPGMGFSYNFGFNPMYSIIGLLSLLFKVLIFILIVSLILALVVFLKNQYEQGNLSFFGTGRNQKTDAIAGNVNDGQSPDTPEKNV